MVKFLHTSDWHLGAKMSQLPDSKAISRREESIRVFSSIISRSIEMGVDIAILAGDIFDNPNPSVKLRKSFVRIIAPLVDKGIDIFIIPGTHDYYSDGGVWDDPEFSNLKIFRKEGFSSFDVDKFNLALWGIPVLKSNQDKNWLKEPPQVDRNKINILVYHGDYRNAGREFEAWYYPFENADLQNLPFDYIALGHHHDKEIIGVNGVEKAIYTGSPYGWSFRKSETADRFFVIGELEKSKLAISFQDIPCSKMHFIQINLENQSQIHDAITKLSSLDEKDFVRILLKGKGELDSIANELSDFQSRFAYFQFDDQCAPDFSNLPSDNHYLSVLLRLLDERLKSGEITDEFHQRICSRAIKLFLE